MVCVIFLSECDWDWVKRLEFKRRYIDDADDYGGVWIPYSTTSTLLERFSFCIDWKYRIFWLSHLIVYPLVLFFFWFVHTDVSFLEVCAHFFGSRPRTKIKYIGLESASPLLGRCVYRFHLNTFDSFTLFQTNSDALFCQQLRWFWSWLRSLSLSLLFPL